MKDDRLYLLHILESAEKIVSYTQEGRDVFLATPLIQDAVVRNFQIIGEAAKKVSPTLKSEYSHIRWRDIAGFRTPVRLISQIHFKGSAFIRKHLMSSKN